MTFSLLNKYILDNAIRNKGAIISKLQWSPLNVTTISNYSMKSNLPIKWVRPEKIPCYKPEKSGDLQPLLAVDIKQLAPEFRDLEEIKSANEYVKKLFTLEYQPYKKTVGFLREEYLGRVKRHKFDGASPEARVAKMTADIRDMQKYVGEFPHDKRARVRLKETIDKRKRLLKLIRKMDYRCFEYILEKLDLVYKANPGQDVYKRVERKRSLRMLTKQYCDNIVETRLSEYKEQLESQQEDFLIEKIETLKWVMEQESAFKVSPTVAEADIKAIEDQLQKLRIERQNNVVLKEE